MKSLLTTLGVLLALLSCNTDDKIKPGEVEATITGFIIADNWGKGCSSGGLEIKFDDTTATINNSVSADYEDANAWPIPVWVRYQPASPDTCNQGINRIQILSIRKKP